MKPTKRRVSGWQNQKKKKTAFRRPAAGSPADGVSEGENWAARHATNDALATNNNNLPSANLAYPWLSKLMRLPTRQGR